MFKQLQAIQKTVQRRVRPQMPFTNNLSYTPLTLQYHPARTTSAFDHSRSINLVHFQSRFKSNRNKRKYNDEDSARALQADLDAPLSDDEFDFIVAEEVSKAQEDKQNQDSSQGAASQDFDSINIQDVAF